MNANTQGNGKRTIILSVEVDWENYDDVSDELIIEDAFPEMKKGVSITLLPSPTTEEGIEEEAWMPVVGDCLEDMGEVLAHHPAWVDEDFNTEGTRVGFLNGDGLFYSAKWNNYQDCYQEDTEHIPTHFCKPPKKK